MHGSVLASDTPHSGRRAFLKFGLTVGLATGGGMLIGFGLPAKADEQASAATPATGTPDPDAVIAGDGEIAPSADLLAPNAFVRIDKAGVVSLVIPKVEMGQGVYTSIPMLLAEELEVPLDTVRIEHAPPDAKLYGDPLLGGQLTGGSTSIRYAWKPLRQAGATARVMLITAAAQQWSVDPSTCHAEAGAVVHAASGRKAAYGDLVDAAAKLPVPPNVPIKDPKDFKLVGKPTNRIDSHEKVDGRAQFGMDVRLPDMVYAAIVNSPVLGGTVVSVDDSVALKTPGVKQVVRIDNAVAVIGVHTWAAKAGASALKIEWHEGEHGTVSTQDLVADLARASQRSGGVARKEGDVTKAFSQAAQTVDVVYEQPFLAHATMEPMNCTVWVKPDSCEIWVGTQVPTRAVDMAAQVTGLPADKITLHNFLIGGGFGRRLEVDGVGQAVKIAKQVNGPVKVIYTREEDVQHDMYRPYYYDRISAGLDANHKPVAWKHRIVGSSILARFAPPAYQNGVDPDAVEVASNLPYDLPNQLVDYVRQEPRSVPTAFWRGVGPTRSTFVVESFVDELAHEAKADPVEYRRSLLTKSPRALNVLNVAAKAGHWGQPLKSNQGRGISVMNAFGSFFSIVMEVTVVDGQVKVDRAVCAVDCGYVVNPKTIEAQIEGGIIFGISAALFSEITLKNGRVEQSNFTDYRILRMNEAPPVELHLVASTEAPGGIGEPGTAATAAALSNAIFAATGKRLRKLPVGRQLET
ncbi:molybdopterin cofactor-binding domain-containing protein [Pararobbsia alpina]|uniref:xanthine dehydrogenase family protein molybdopterin-binding subunit n=1 Tax=Pararobbsia alpina TaxID=621374 RepID=UPI0039A4E1CF